MIKKEKTYKLVGSKDLFKITVIVTVLTILGIYFWGLGVHNTFYENSIISTTILSIAFFLFVTIGLYNGIKLKDDMGNIIGNYRPVDPTSHMDLLPGGDVDVGEGILGIIIAVVLWIIMAIVFAIALWIFANVVVIMILTFIAMLYWVFFRALRLVFKNSNKSKGDLLESIKWGFTYTVLYNFWIYAIFIFTHYLKY